MIAKRMKAFQTDYLIILTYMLLLFAITASLSALLSFQLNTSGPFKGELIGFTTLTMPVILYFSFCENSRYGGTLGKRKYGLKVVKRNLLKPKLLQLIVRNAIKFLPWEMAH